MQSSLNISRELVPEHTPLYQLLKSLIQSLVSPGSCIWGFNELQLINTVSYWQLVESADAEPAKMEGLVYYLYTLCIHTHIYIYINTYTGLEGRLGGK